MALDDYLESEVGIAVAATAVVLSPQVRNALRRGAVVGLAAAIKVGDAISNAARGVASEAQGAMASGVDGAQATVAEAKSTARGSRASRTAQSGEEK